MSTPYTSQLNRHEQRAVCGLCERSYTRKSHLWRHMQTHHSTQKHICQQCSKSFARHDSFRRHQEICPAKPKDSAKNTRIVSSRACTQCARGRTRCSHESPCARCFNKGLACMYPRNIGHESLLKTSSEMVADVPKPSVTLPSCSLLKGAIHARSRQGSASFPGTSLPSPQEGEEEVRPHSSIGIREYKVISNVVQTRTEETSFITQYGDTGAVSPLFLEGSRDLHAGGPTSTPNTSISYGTDWVPPVATSHQCGTISLLEMRDQHNTSSRMEQLVRGDDDISSELYSSETYQARQKNSMCNIQAYCKYNSSNCTHSLSNGDTSSAHAEQLEHQVSNVPSPEIRPTKRYAAGGGARDTVFKTVHSCSRRSVAVVQTDGSDHRRSFSFPDTTQYDGNEPTEDWSPITEPVYQQIHDMFNHLCRGTSTIFPSYGSSNFLSRTQANACARGYFDNFHLAFPFLHKATFPHTDHTALTTLAVVAVGAFFVNYDRAIELQTALHELLRRALLVHGEALERNPLLISCLSYVQASLLSVVGMYHVGNAIMLSQALGSLTSLIEFCRRHQFFQGYNLRERDIASVTWSQDWETWRIIEESRRTVYCIWLFDGILEYQRHRTPCLRLDDIHLPLPCADHVFETASGEWSLPHFTDTKDAPSLSVCLNMMETENRLLAPASELSHTLLIHGLFSRCRQVTEGFSHLSRFNKSGLSFTNSKWSSSRLHYSEILGWQPWVEWRNRMCDCLDLLHAHSNGITGHSFGFERPVVLHLHLARIILLSPYQEIRQVVRFLVPEELDGCEISATGDMTAARYSEALEAVRFWLTRDGYKMRLSVVHAGAIFWHVRRYSVQSFCEPTALFLAALVIWTYSLRNKFLKPLPTDPQVQPEVAVITPNISPSERDWSWNADDHEEVLRISIDRPLDDEAVQAFVHSQEAVEVNMGRVGSLDLTKAPEKMLNEAARLLKLRCSAWPMSIRYRECLTCLADPSRQLGQQTTI